MSGDGGADSLPGSLVALVAYGAIDVTMALHGNMGNTTVKRIKTYKRHEIVNRTNLDSRSDVAATSVGEVSITRTHTDIYNLKHIRNYYYKD